MFQKKKGLQSLNVAVVFVRCGNEKYTNTHRVFDRLLGYWGWKPRRKIVIENDRLLPLDSPGEGWEIMHGDNRCAEFSGIAHCLNADPTLSRDFDGIIFVTSAFLMNFNQYLRGFTREALTFGIRKQAFLGHFDEYPEPVNLMGNESKRWMRTACFFAPKRGLELLRIWSIQDSSRFFSGRLEEPFKSDAPLSGLYQRYLIDWLTGNGINNQKWHSSFNLTEESLSNFYFKSMCILNEHHLTMQARSVNLPIVDVGAFHHMSKGKRLCDLPSEESQISLRNYHFANLANPCYQLLVKWPP
jgi:hypothetical protein